MLVQLPKQFGCVNLRPTGRKLAAAIRGPVSILKTQQYERNTFREPEVGKKAHTLCLSKKLLQCDSVLTKQIVLTKPVFLWMGVCQASITTSLHSRPDSVPCLNMQRQEDVLMPDSASQISWTPDCCVTWHLTSAADCYWFNSPFATAFLLPFISTLVPADRDFWQSPSGMRV